MKKVTFGIACGLVCIFVVTMMLTLFGRAARKMETEYMLAQAMDSSLSAVMHKQDGTIAGNGEFVADFLKALLIQADSNSDITVSVLDADAKKGILSMEVVEKFLHPNGNEGSVSQVRTVIFDKAMEQETEYHKVGFYMDGDEVYKEYCIPKGSVCSIPVSPQKEGKKFLYWCFVTGGAGKAGTCNKPYPGGEVSVLASAGSPYIVLQDTKLIAVFE